MEHSTNLLDLLAACWRGIKLAARWVTTLLSRSIRLTWRKWYIVIPMTIVGIVVSLVITQSSYREYKVDGVLALYGPTAFEVQQSMRSIERALPGYMGPTQQMAQMLDISEEAAGAISHVAIYPIVDFKHDSVPDEIDYRLKASLADTVNPVMTNYVALQFRTRNPQLLPEIEAGFLHFLNSNPQHQAAYEVRRAEAEREALFCQTQVELLDSFTTVFYFQQGNGIQSQVNAWREGSILGRREIILLHNEIIGLMRTQKKVEHELANMTAPVVVESSLAVDPRPVWRRSRVCPLVTIAGWVLGLLLAWMIEDRKRLLQWLNSRD